MDTIKEVEKFIKAQPDYGNGQYAVHASSHEGWSLSYSIAGQIRLVEYRFKVNDKGVPFDYQRL